MPSCFGCLKIGENKMVEPKKISENVYEIPKTGKMNVGVRIYASEKILAAIKQDKTLEQARNMAMLPGVIKNIVVCPDAHQGYGACIGGVAAYDINKGVISPGEIGYDINCLTGDSKILTEFGTYKKIKDFEKDFINIGSGNLKLLQISKRLKTLNLDSKEIENKEIMYFIKKNSEKIYEIETEAGFKLKATIDHPFLTKQGMKEIKNLNNKNDVAVFLFKGIEEKEEINEKKTIISKIFGYLLGDGTTYFCNGKGYTVAYGSKEDLEKMKKDLERIEFKSSIYYRERNHKINNYYGINEFRAGCYELHIRTGFASLLRNLGMPIGKKIHQKYSIPKWIKNSSDYIKRAFLAGFFGAELSSPKTHTKTGFLSPILGQNKSNELKNNMKKFMLEITELLSEFDIKVNKISEVNYPKVSTIRLIISANEDNLLKLWRTIGFEYNKKRQQLANIASLYILKKKKITEKRNKIAEKIKEYKQKEFSLRELQEVFASKITNKRFIERHYYENAGQRIPLDFISFNNFKEQCFEDLEKYGCLFDKIKNIKEAGKENVYDFTVKDNHNFIANSFIVSNCGVRLLTSNLMKKDVQGKIKQIVEEIYVQVPSGVGRGGKMKLSNQEIKKVLETGSNWAVKKGFGTKEDLEKTEDNGCIKGAKATEVSQRAIARGMPQLGSLGAGNHFLEIGYVDEIYDKKTAKVFGIEKKDQITFMIHCGSRGLGHQVASDYIKAMEEKYGYEKLPDRELINAPIKSELGKKYISAMAAAANFGFCNRHLIMHWARQAFEKIFGKKVQLNMVYDVAHNMAKFEEHIIDGKKMMLCIHRKGATRSFGPGRKELPKIYKDVGQPVIIPGSMGTASYVLVGTKKAEEVSFGSTAHGAGRVMSRYSALKKFRGEKTKSELADKDIEVKSGSWKSLAEEAPGVYKDIDEVVRVSHDVGIGNLVARLKPLGVVKG